MNTPISINTALCLPASDVVALGQGRMIAALSNAFVNSIQQFALCPIEEQNSSSNVSINLWAKIEFCKIYTQPEDAKKLAKLTVWSNENLQRDLQERYKLFLLCLRVFQIPQAIELSVGRVNTSKLGSFIKLPSYIATNHSVPILDDDSFAQHRKNLINLEEPRHPELEELQEAISELATSNNKAKGLNNLIQGFLGWKSNASNRKSKQEIDWIYDIDTLGNRSKELDEGKSNYQAGTDFENIVRRGLEFLGFSIDTAYRGRAGGLDLFCSKPYALVGECKAGKTIPSGTTQELIRLGGMHLGADQFLASSKLIIGPGSPTPNVLTAAAQWRVSIISPMSLQKLVELQAMHPGSIDLIELKQYLEPGQINDRIDEYVEKVLEEIKLRSHIVKVVKSHLSNVQATDSNLDILFGVYCGSNPPKFVSQTDFHTILIELSSPLTGYLGRVKNSDRFYYLRDLVVE